MAKIKLSGQNILAHAFELFRQSELLALREMAEECIKQRDLSEIGKVLIIISRLAIGPIQDGLTIIDTEKNKILSVELAAKVGRCLLDFEAYSLLIQVCNVSLGRIERAIWIYFGGCAWMMSGDQDKAFDYFDCLNT